MPLPSNRGRRDTVAGGTAVAQESQTSLWLGLGALLVVVAGVVYAASSKDDAPQPAETASEALVVEETDESTATQAVAGDEDEVGISLDEAPATDYEKRTQARANFEEILNEARLWTTITVEGEAMLSLVSGACLDDAMQPAIARAAESLTDVGFTTIRCLEKHGQQVFEQAL
ncbi:MAG: hypothetical protein GY811_27000 [Myxococcales bacterium]|nr:hypothetical protein [Myxococcales bacterium]